MSKQHPPLADRVASFLSTPTMADVGTVLMVELESVHETTIGELANAKARSINPLLNAEQAAAAKEFADHLTFDETRIRASIDAVSGAVERLQISERAGALRRERAAALAERDALADEWREFYPTFSRRMTELVQKTIASDQRLEGLREGAVSAEAVARGCAGNWMWGGLSPVNRLTKIRLPLFDRQGDAWGESRVTWAVEFPGLEAA